MGVFEDTADHLGMHWQQQHQQQAAGPVYDPSRDLSPNLPVTPCDSSSMGDAEASSSGCSTPTSSSVASQLSGGGGQHASPPPPPPTDVVCAGCGGRIRDRYYLLAVDRRWHASCLTCCACRRPLEGENTCFARDGSIYCKKDYQRLFGVRRCGRCQAAILPSELVMRARELVFHVHCFTCAACGALLTKGDHFGMRDSAVFCRLHFELRCDAPPPPPPHQAPPFVPPPPHQHPTPFPSPEYHALPPPLQPPPPAAAAAAASGLDPKVGFFNGGGTTRQKGRPRKRKTKDLEHMTANLDINADYLDTPFGRGPGTPGVVNGQQRTKRMRTSFKHHQLRTMKSYFAINHNPDAKDLKQLSQKTGLPKRVLQVWFQNARAKWRRMVLKQEGKGGSDKCGGGGDSGLDAYQAAAAAGADYHRQQSLSPPFLLGASPSPLECS